MPTEKSPQLPYFEQCPVSFAATQLVSNGLHDGIIAISDEMRTRSGASRHEFTGFRVDIPGVRDARVVTGSVAAYRKYGGLLGDSPNATDKSLASSALGERAHGAFAIDETIPKSPFLTPRTKETIHTNRGLKDCLERRDAAQDADTIWRLVKTYAKNGHSLFAASMMAVLNTVGAKQQIPEDDIAYFDAASSHRTHITIAAFLSRSGRMAGLYDTAHTTISPDSRRRFGRVAQQLYGTGEAAQQQALLLPGYRVMGAAVYWAMHRMPQYPGNDMLREYVTEVIRQDAAPLSVLPRLQGAVRPERDQELHVISPYVILKGAEFGANARAFSLRRYEQQGAEKLPHIVNALAFGIGHRCPADEYVPAVLRELVTTIRTDNKSTLFAPLGPDKKTGLHVTKMPKRSQMAWLSTIA